MIVDEIIKQFARDCVDRSLIGDALGGWGISKHEDPEVWDASGGEVLSPNRAVLGCPGLGRMATKPVNQNDASSEKKSASIVDRSKPEQIGTRTRGTGGPRSWSCHARASVSSRL